MSIAKFAFTKSWTSASDFPTIQTDEIQVRADMQFLFDEIKNYLNNTMLSSVDDAITAMQTWTTSAVADATTGTLPDGSIAAVKFAAGAVESKIKNVTYGDLS